MELDATVSSSEIQRWRWLGGDYGHQVVVQWWQAECAGRISPQMRNSRSMTALQRQHNRVGERRASIESDTTMLASDIGQLRQSKAPMVVVSLIFVCGFDVFVFVARACRMTAGGRVGKQDTNDDG